MKILYNTVLNFMKEVYHKIPDRRIMLISRENIRCIEFSTGKQWILLAIFLAFCFWFISVNLKFSWQKYEFVKTNLETKITQKKNHELEKQVKDLQAHLVIIGKYFEVAGKYKTIPSEIEEIIDDMSKVNENDFDKNSSIENEKIINQLNSSIDKKINRLKGVISITGINVKTNQAIAFDKSTNYANKGGPIIDEFRARKYSNQNIALRTSPNSNLPPYLSDIENKLQHLLYLENLISKMPLINPVKTKHYFSSGFGYRIDPITKQKTLHSGLDIVGPKNTKIYSTASGKVVFAGFKGNYGYTVEIKHENDIRTRYSHLKKILVKQGQYIDKRKLIGIQGNTGRSTGDHLHYEVMYKNNLRDPHKFIEAGKYLF